MSRRPTSPPTIATPGLPPPEVRGVVPPAAPGRTAANSPSCVEVTSNVFPPPAFNVDSGVHDVPLNRSIAGAGDEVRLRRMTKTASDGDAGSRSGPPGV